MPNELQIDAFLKQIKESEEFGEQSCSTVYEAMDDDDIRMEIRGMLIENPNATYDDIAKGFREREKIFWEIMDDREAIYW